MDICGRVLFDHGGGSMGLVGITITVAAWSMWCGALLT